tara:strand:+ start:10 stop:3072 length:3063 start_codon:yes stop_codon:yes gene_type:complete
MPKSEAGKKTNSSILNLIPPSVQAATRIKFAVMDTLDTVNIGHGPHGEPMFKMPSTEKSPLSEDIFAFSEFMTTARSDVRVREKHIGESRDSVFYYGSVKLRGIPSSAHNLALFCMLYNDNQDLANYFSSNAKSHVTKPTSMRILRSPHKRYKILERGNTSRLIEKLYYPNGTEYIGYPYMQGEGTSQVFSTSPNPQTENMLTKRSVANNMVQDLRNIDRLTNPIDLNFSSTHNVVKSLNPVLKDLSQRLDSFENGALFSTLQHSFSENGNVSGMFSVNILSILQNEAAYPSLLDRTRDRDKMAFISDVLSMSKLITLSVYREKINSHAEISQLGREDNFLTYETDEAPHMVVTKKEGRVSEKFLPLENTSAVPGDQQKRLCGRLEQLPSTRNNFGVRHFAFKDFDISSKEAGFFQYSCKMRVENGLLKALAKRAKMLNDKKSMLTDVFEIACMGSQAKGMGYFNNNTKRFSNEFLTKVYRTYTLGYQDIIKQTVDSYVSVYFALFDRKNKTLSTKEGEKNQDTFLLKNPIQMTSVLVGLSKTMDGLQILISVFDDLVTTLHKAIDSNDKNILSQGDNSKVDGGSKSPKAILEIEANLKNLVHVSPQKQNKYDFIFNSQTRNSRKTIFREIEMTEFEERWKREQKKYFRNEVVDERQRFTIPYGQGQVEGQNSYNSLLFFSPARVCGSFTHGDVVLDTVDEASFATIVTRETTTEKSSEALKNYKEGFFRLLYESLSLNNGDGDEIAKSISVNELLGSTENVTIAEGNEFVSSTEAGLGRDNPNKTNKDTMKGNLHSLSVISGVEDFEDLMGYVSLTSLLKSYNDDLRVYDLNKQKTLKAKDLASLKSLGFTLVNSNIAGKIKEDLKKSPKSSPDDSARSLFNSLPLSVKSLIINASNGNNLEILNDTNLTRLAGINSLTQADILPYFILNYKVLTTFEIFSGYQTTIHRDGETGVKTSQSMMGEPIFRQANMEQLRQVVQNRGRALCRVKRYFRGFINIKENEHFDFPIANSLFMIRGK